MVYLGRLQDILDPGANYGQVIIKKEMKYFEEESFGPDIQSEPKFISILPKEPLYMKKYKKIKKERCSKG